MDDTTLTPRDQQKVVIRSAGTPRWDKAGEPATFSAALLDCLEWLNLMAQQMDAGRLTLRGHADNRQRLGLAIAATERLLQEGETDAGLSEECHY